MQSNDGASEVVDFSGAVKACTNCAFHGDRVSEEFEGLLVCMLNDKNRKLVEPDHSCDSFELQSKTAKREDAPTAPAAIDRTGWVQIDGIWQKP